MTPSAAIIIRPVTLDDVQAYRLLRIEALTRCPLAFSADPAEAEARPIEEWRTQIAAATGDARNVIMLADTGDAGLAGMAGVFTAPQPKVAHAGTVWGVYVREEFRGRGVARALTEACIAWARRKKLALLKLAVLVGNDTARRCYERCGFRVYGLDPMALRWDGRYHDEHMMMLRLDEPRA